MEVHASPGEISSASGGKLTFLEIPTALFVDHAAQSNWKENRRRVEVPTGF
jgi:hypothetical protein